LSKAKRSEFLKIFVRLLNVRVVGGLWVRLGKIKYAAKALASVSACSSLNFAKRWQIVLLFSVRLLSVVSFYRVAPNVLGLGVVADF
jgi:hypothetical protein